MYNGFAVRQGAGGVWRATLPVRRTLAEGPFARKAQTGPIASNCKDARQDGLSPRNRPRTTMIVFEKDLKSGSGAN
jgi:hypothetical protein